MVARYEYDALNRRTKAFLNADTDDDFDSFRHFYYTFGWQLLETRLSESENTEPQTLQPEVQYVWSARYLDAPVLRDKNTDSDDLCDDQRLYFANDANMNVTALIGGVRGEFGGSSGDTILNSVDRRRGVGRLRSSGDTILNSVDRRRGVGRLEAWHGSHGWSFRDIRITSRSAATGGGVWGSLGIPNSVDRRRGVGRLESST